MTDSEFKTGGDPLHFADIERQGKAIFIASLGNLVGQNQSAMHRPE